LLRNLVDSAAEEGEAQERDQDGSVKDNPAEFYGIYGLAIANPCTGVVQ
jgi:hypothetical protein